MREMAVKTRKEQLQDINKIVLKAAEFLGDKKARDIVVLDLRDKTSITDYFVICTANLTVQTKSLVHSLRDFMNRFNMKPLSKNSGFDSPWVLLDYNYFVVHIFLQEGRNYYQLEKLWSDARVVYSHEGGIL